MPVYARVQQQRRPKVGPTPKPPPPKRPTTAKAKIITEDGLNLVLPFAPREVTHDGFADDYAVLARPGRTPLTVRTGNGLRSVSFTVWLGYADHQRSIEPLLATLAKIARTGDRITLSLSSLEGGVKWNLAGLGVNTLLRQQGTNAVTRATAALTFTEDVDAVINVGPLSGGKKKKKGKGGLGGKGKGGGSSDNDRPNAPGSRAKNTTQRHTVAPGETLARIALLYYGDPNDWRIIAQASGVRDPRKVKAGDRLTIPPAE